MPRRLLRVLAATCMTSVSPSLSYADDTVLAPTLGAVSVANTIAETSPKNLVTHNYKNTWKYQLHYNNSYCKINSVIVRDAPIPIFI